MGSFLASPMLLSPRFEHILIQTLRPDSQGRSWGAGSFLWWDKWQDREGPLLPLLPPSPRQPGRPGDLVGAEGTVTRGRWPVWG